MATTIDDDDDNEDDEGDVVDDCNLAFRDDNEENHERMRLHTARFM
jgi:hypothetical protein